MLIKSPFTRLAVFGFLLAALTACNLPQSQPATPAPLPVEAAPSSTPLPATSLPEATAAASATPAETPSVAHLLTPDPEIKSGGVTFYDVDSSGTGPEHRAPYGEYFQFNRFERPFTQTEMLYLANLDIVTFKMDQDANWNYASINLIGNDPNDPLQINFGVEIDQNRDGFGDILIWVQPPYSTTWSVETVQVYRDKNRDSGGGNASAAESAASGNGYESLEFDRGQGSDPDLAWVRIDPNDTSNLQIAFKRSLAGDAFLWNPWADAGLKDPAKFSYNDRLTFPEAGSAVRDNANYPIKALFAVDNSCRANFGFAPTGSEPLLCTYAQPTAKPEQSSDPQQPGTTPPAPGCQPPPGGCPYGFAAEPFCMCIPG